MQMKDPVSGIVFNFTVIQLISNHVNITSFGEVNTEFKTISFRT